MRFQRAFQSFGMLFLCLCYGEKVMIINEGHIKTHVGHNKHK